MRTISTIFILFCLLASSSAVGPDAQLPPDELVQRVVRIETEAMRTQRPRWMYFLNDDKNGTSTMRAVLETQQGTISKLVCRNRQPLSQPETLADHQHLEQLASNPAEQRKHMQREKKDQARISELIRMLGSAFRFEYLGMAGNLVRLRFYPNPEFRAANIEQRIFYAITGTVLIDPIHSRLARITGYFSRDVDFGAGLLGKVKQGGTVDIARQDVGRGDWNPVELHVGVKARVLFKSLDVRRNLRFWGFRPVHEGLSVRDAVKLLEQQPASCQP